MDLKTPSEQFIADVVESRQDSASDFGAAETAFFKLNDLIGKRILLYGNGDGYITFKCFVVDKYGLEVELILDSKFSDVCFVDGISAMAPGNYQPDADFCESGVVIITVGKTNLYPAIYQELTVLGFKNIITAFQVYEYHLSHSDFGFIQQIVPFLYAQQQAIHDAYSALMDAKSQHLFIAVLKFYAGVSAVKFAHEPIEYQYFPHDVPLQKGFQRVINCGSYDGDTVRQLFKLKGKVAALACFEPDPENYQNLANYLQQSATTIAEQCVAFPCGVHGRNQQLKFNSGDRINSSVSDSGQSMIQCVALDSALPNFAPTFINMDVEGSEPDALLGARNLISQHRPDLAICVYHKPSHLWEILHLIRGMDASYQFYLRNYTGYPAETVLYCVAAD